MLMWRFLLLLLPLAWHEPSDNRDLLLVVVDAAEASLDLDGEVDSSYSTEVVKLLMADMEEQTAVNIAAIIQQSRADPETENLVAHMKEQDEYKESMSDLSSQQVHSGLQQAFSEMEMAELLFQDLDRAFVEMHKDGMIPPHRVEEYRENPALLAEDTRRSLYFTFVTFAAAGGYL